MVLQLYCAPTPFWLLFPEHSYLCCGVVYGLFEHQQPELCIEFQVLPYSTMDLSKGNKVMMGLFLMDFLINL